MPILVIDSSQPVFEGCDARLWAGCAGSRAARREAPAEGRAGEVVRRVAGLPSHQPLGVPSPGTVGARRLTTNLQRGYGHAVQPLVNAFVHAKAKQAKERPRIQRVANRIAPYQP